MLKTVNTTPSTPQPRRTADEAEIIWRARDRYRAKRALQAWGILAGAVVLLCVLGFLSGCQDMSRSVAKLTGCEDRALDAGYCHMPKAVQP